jgi:hypothetical protein
VGLVTSAVWNVVPGFSFSTVCPLGLRSPPYRSAYFFPSAWSFPQNHQQSRGAVSPISFTICAWYFSALLGAQLS